DSPRRTVGRDELRDLWRQPVPWWNQHVDQPACRTNHGDNLLPRQRGSARFREPLYRDLRRDVRPRGREGFRSTGRGGRRHRGGLDMSNVLDLTDQTLFLAERAASTTNVLQCIWVYDRGVDMDG